MVSPEDSTFQRRWIIWRIAGLEAWMTFVWTGRKGAIRTLLNVPLGEAFKKIWRILFGFGFYDTNHEIENYVSFTKNIEDVCLEIIFNFIRNLSIHNCQLKFKDLSFIMRRRVNRNNSYNLYNNVFIDKSHSYREPFKKYSKNLRLSINASKIFDLKRCNFS